MASTAQSRGYAYPTKARYPLDTFYTAASHVASLAFTAVQGPFYDAVLLHRAVI